LSKEDDVGSQRESIGVRLKRVRLKRELSQRELETEGVSYAYISRLEAGVRQPSRKALERIAEKLHVSALFLERGAGKQRCPHCLNDVDVPEV
jgi:transcriptional regulator with XRE-family HTH domain